MTSPTDLPPNVRRLVDEIENEIGETSVAIDDITGSRGKDHAGEPPTDNGKVESAVREILLEIGEDPDREGLAQTPERVADMYAEIFEGIPRDASQEMDVVFNADHDEFNTGTLNGSAGVTLEKVKLTAKHSRSSTTQPAPPVSHDRDAIFDELAIA